MQTEPTQEEKPERKAANEPWSLLAAVSSRWRQPDNRGEMDNAKWDNGRETGTPPPKSRAPALSPTSEIASYRHSRRATEISLDQVEQQVVNASASSGVTTEEAAVVALMKYKELEIQKEQLDQEIDRRDLNDKNLVQLEIDRRDLIDENQQLKLRLQRKEGRINDLTSKKGRINDLTSKTIHDLKESNGKLEEERKALIEENEKLELDKSDLLYENEELEQRLKVKDERIKELSNKVFGPSSGLVASNKGEGSVYLPLRTWSSPRSPSLVHTGTQAASSPASAFLLPTVRKIPTSRSDVNMEPMESQSADDDEVDNLIKQVVNSGLSTEEAGMILKMKNRKLNQKIAVIEGQLNKREASEQKLKQEQLEQLKAQEKYGKISEQGIANKLKQQQEIAMLEEQLDKFGGLEQEKDDTRKGLEQKIDDMRKGQDDMRKGLEQDFDKRLREQLDEQQRELLEKNARTLQCLKTAFPSDEQLPATASQGAAVILERASVALIELVADADKKLWLAAAAETGNALSIAYVVVENGKDYGTIQLVLIGVCGLFLLLGVLFFGRKIIQVLFCASRHESLSSQTRRFALALGKLALFHQAEGLTRQPGQLFPDRGGSSRRPKKLNQASSSPIVEEAQEDPISNRNAQLGQRLAAAPVLTPSAPVRAQDLDAILKKEDHWQLEAPTAEDMRLDVVPSGNSPFWAVEERRCQFFVLS
jgi:hypothetical protein